MVLYLTPPLVQTPDVLLPAFKGLMCHMLNLCNRVLQKLNPIYEKWVELECVYIVYCRFWLISICTYNMATIAQIYSLISQYVLVSEHKIFPRNGSAVQYSMQQLYAELAS